MVPCKPGGVLFSRGWYFLITLVVLTIATRSVLKDLCQSLLFNKVSGLRPATSLRKRLWHRCFPLNFAKFLRTLFLTENLRWLLLWLETYTTDTWTPPWHMDDNMMVQSRNSVPISRHYYNHLRFLVFGTIFSQKFLCEIVPARLLKHV